MNAEPNKASDQSNSENENDEGKSEEFLNFERALKGILAITPEEAKEIVRRTPYPKDGEGSKEDSAANN